MKKLVNLKKFFNYHKNKEQKTNEQKINLAIESLKIKRHSISLFFFRNLFNFLIYFLVFIKNIDVHILDVIEV